MKPVHDKIYLQPHCRRTECPAYIGSEYDEFGICWASDVPWEACPDCNMQCIEYSNPKVEFTDDAHQT
ncbi:MAG: hypothetical protein OXH65_03030 [Paracoccaceae bacterium]|nr:hypothetical protein [Paracoccaceae bacterium]